MAQRAVFLDRDNTIIASDGYLGDPSKVKLIPGAAAALASLRRLGYRIIVVSNQSGVAKGLFDEAAVEAVNAEMVRQLREQAGAAVDASYYCPFHPEAVAPEYRLDHEWRKPRPGMLKAAAQEFDLNLSECWMIGDQPQDIAAGASVGCRTILLSDPERPLDVRENSPAITPNFAVRTLADAARIIVREGNNPLRDPAPAPLKLSDSRQPEPNTSSGQPVPVSAPDAGGAPGIARDDPAAWAEAIADRLAVRKHSESLKPLLEEMAQHLRNLSRRQHMQEFSLSLLVAAMCQMFVLVFLAIAAWDGVGAMQIHPVAQSPWWYLRTTNQLNALEWLVAALVVQGIVLALHLRHRDH